MEMTDHGSQDLQHCDGVQQHGSGGADIGVRSQVLSSKMFSPKMLRALSTWRINWSTVGDTPLGTSRELQVVLPPATPPELLPFPEHLPLPEHLPRVWVLPHL